MSNELVRGGSAVSRFAYGVLRSAGGGVWAPTRVLLALCVLAGGTVLSVRPAWLAERVPIPHTKFEDRARGVSAVGGFSVIFATYWMFVVVGTGVFWARMRGVSTPAHGWGRYVRGQLGW